MTELKDDPVYRLPEKHYPNLLLDYAVFSADLPYQGEVSHKEAAMAAILAFPHRHRVGNRYDPGTFTPEPDKMQDGKDWWGTYFRTIYDKHLQRFVIIGASLID